MSGPCPAAGPVISTSPDASPWTITENAREILKQGNSCGGPNFEIGCQRAGKLASDLSLRRGVRYRVLCMFFRARRMPDSCFRARKHHRKGIRENISFPGDLSVGFGARPEACAAEQAAAAHGREYRVQVGNFFQELFGDCGLPRDDLIVIESVALVSACTRAQTSLREQTLASHSNRSPHQVL